MDSPETSPEPDRRTCQALLEDELTPCTRTLNPRTNSRWCPPHGKEYKEHTRTYKTLSDQVRALKDAARLSRKRRQELSTTDEVDAAIARVEEWREAILSEIAARARQHKRFFPIPGALPASPAYIHILTLHSTYQSTLAVQTQATSSGYKASGQTRSMPRTSSSSFGHARPTCSPKTRRSAAASRTRSARGSTGASARRASQHMPGSGGVWRTSGASAPSFFQPPLQRRRGPPLLWCVSPHASRGQRTAPWLLPRQR